MLVFHLGGTPSNFSSTNSWKKKPCQMKLYQLSWKWLESRSGVTWWNKNTWGGGGGLTSQGVLSLATVVSTTWTEVVKPSVAEKGPSQDFTHLEGWIISKYNIIWQKSVASAMSSPVPWPSPGVGYVTLLANAVKQGKPVNHLHYSQGTNPATYSEQNRLRILNSLSQRS